MQSRAECRSRAEEATPRRMESATGLKLRGGGQASKLLTIYCKFLKFIDFYLKTGGGGGPRPQGPPPGSGPHAETRGRAEMETKPEEQSSEMSSAERKKRAESALGICASTLLSPRGAKAKTGRVPCKKSERETLAGTVAKSTYTGSARARGCA